MCETYGRIIDKKFDFLDEEFKNSEDENDALPVKVRYERERENSLEETFGIFSFCLLSKLSNFCHFKFF